MRWLLSGVFIVLHGLVFLLYAGQSWRLFELQRGMDWPEGSWAFSKHLGDETTRWVASSGYIMTAIGFVAGGTGMFLRMAWWRPVVMGSAAFSALLIFLFWDGGMVKLADKGGIGLLINLSILVVLLFFRWPYLGL